MVPVLQQLGDTYRF